MTTTIDTAKSRKFFPRDTQTNSLAYAEIHLLCDEIDRLRLAADTMAARLLERDREAARLIGERDEAHAAAQRNAEGRRNMTNLLDGEVAVRIAETARAEKAEASVAALRAVVQHYVDENQHKHNESAIEEAFVEMADALTDTAAVAARFVDVDSEEFRALLESAAFCAVGRCAVAPNGAPSIEQVAQDLDGFIADFKAKRAAR